MYMDKKSFRKTSSYYIAKLKIVFYDPKILERKHREIPVI